MPIQKIKSGRIITTLVNEYVGEKGMIFYDEDIPELRLSDGITPGGIIFTGGGGTGTYVLVTATNVRLGGIKVGSGLSITGDGTLSAIATSTYTLVTATTTSLGGVKIGSNVSISADGTISVAAPYTLVTATTTRLGGIKVGSGLSITGDGTLSAIATSTYVLPIASTSTLGGIKVGKNLSISPDGTLDANTATSGGAGDSFSTIVTAGSPNLLASGADTLELIAGLGVSITSSATSSPYKSITIDAASYLGNIDGGWPDADYGGILGIDGGNPFDIFYDGQAIDGGIG